MRRRPRRRGYSRAEHIALAHRSPQLNEQAFRELYARHCQRQGKRVSERGLQTRLELYRSICKRARVEGGPFRSSNSQRAAALDKAGRARCVRTVRRAHRDLEAMGVAIVRHCVRSGPARRPGELDYLGIMLATPKGFTRSSYVRPPFGDGKGPSAFDFPIQKATAKGVIAPPSAAVPPDGGDQRPASERDWLQTEIQFQELKLAAGWKPHRTTAKLHELRARLRCLDDPPPATAELSNVRQLRPGLDGRRSALSRRGSYDPDSA